MIKFFFVSFLFAFFGHLHAEVEQPLGRRYGIFFQAVAFCIFFDIYLRVAVIITIIIIIAVIIIFFSFLS